MNQIDIYRKMTGEQRLELAFKMSKVLRNRVLAQVKKQYPNMIHKQQILIMRGRLDQMDL